jgi:hypothetical protein
MLHCLEKHINILSCTISTSSFNPKWWKSIKIKQKIISEDINVFLYILFTLNTYFILECCFIYYLSMLSMRYMVALAGVIPSLVNVCSINYIDGKVYLILADYQWISSFTDVYCKLPWPLIRILSSTSLYLYLNKFYCEDFKFNGEDCQSQLNVQLSIDVIYVMKLY